MYLYALLSFYSPFKPERDIDKNVYCPIYFGIQIQTSLRQRFGWVTQNLKYKRLVLYIRPSLRYFDMLDLYC